MPYTHEKPAQLIAVVDDDRMLHYVRSDAATKALCGQASPFRVLRAKVRYRLACSLCQDGKEAFSRRIPDVAQNDSESTKGTK